LTLRELKWEYSRTEARPVLVERIFEEEHKIRAVDLEFNVPIPLDVSEHLSIESIKVGGKYLATFKVYTAKLTKEIEKSFEMISKISERHQKMLSFLKATGGYETLYRFELIDIKPL